MNRKSSAFEGLVAEGYLPGYLTHDTKTVFLTPLLGNRFPIFLKLLQDNNQIKLLKQEVLESVGLSPSPVIDGVDYRHMQCFIDEFVEKLTSEKGKWAQIGERLLETMEEDFHPGKDDLRDIFWYSGMSMIACLAAGAMSVYYAEFPPPARIDETPIPLPPALLTHLAQ